MKSFLACVFLALSPALTVAAGHPPHPRLLVTEDDWQKLPERMKSQPEVAKVIGACIARAETTLDEDVLEYKVTGRRLLSVSREAVRRVLDLTTAWKATGDRRYLNRCKTEIMAVCAFKDWHPSHLLDTAEMQAAVAIGYDWLHSELDESERKTIARALLEKGLKTTLPEKRTLRRDNNWNQVCNGGLVLSAVALLDVEPELALSAITEARANIPIAIAAGYPRDGAYGEGVGYWGYGTIYSILTEEALRTAGLQGAGIKEHPGFLESGRYKALSHGNSGLVFNYGDNRESPRRATAAIAWMARESRSASVWLPFAKAFRDIGGSKEDDFLALAAFWIPRPSELAADVLPLHFRGTGKSPIAIHRTGFGTNDLFVGIKAGEAGVNHGHMDAGSFVLDWLGHRWVSDLGPQDYNSLEQTGMNLFDMHQDSRRWTVFRLNHTSHSTLTYNGRRHMVDGAAAIISSKGAPENETVLDMREPLGLPKGASARRTFRFIQDPPTVLVTDTLSGLSPGDTVDWHVMTRAAVKPTTAGYRLTFGKDSIELQLSSAALGQAVGISAKPADPPPMPHDHPNPGYTRIEYRTKAGTDGRLEIEALFKTGR